MKTLPELLQYQFLASEPLDRLGEDPSAMEHFVEGVAQTLRSMGSARQRRGREPEPPPGAPVAFLSYAPEDRAVVEQLAQRLKAAGIKVWEDNANLRAGDNWERIIRHVIEEVDYFVAVQGPGMATRDQGVFYVEINEALQREQRIKQGFKFLIPVYTGDHAGLLPQLSVWHSVSIDTDDGLNNLISSIMEDWGKRRAQ